MSVVRSTKKSSIKKTSSPKKRWTIQRSGRGLDLQVYACFDGHVFFYQCSYPSRVPATAEMKRLVDLLNKAAYVPLGYE